jgi:hypothetical protein
MPVMPPPVRLTDFDMERWREAPRRGAFGSFSAMPRASAPA